MSWEEKEWNNFWKSWFSDYDHVEEDGDWFGNYDHLEKDGDFVWDDLFAEHYHDL